MPTDIRMSKEQLLANSLKQDAAAAALAKKLLTPELQRKYASLLGGVGEIDPARIRVQDQEGLNLHGYAIPHDLTEEELLDSKKEYGAWGMSAEPNTVNILKDKLNPHTIAHELRHLQEPNMSESANRMADAAVAEDEEQWTDAARMYADDSGQLPSEGLHQLLSDLNYIQAGMEYNRQWDKGARPKGGGKWWQDNKSVFKEEKRANAMWPKERESFMEYQDWNKGLKERNAERIKQRQEADALRGKK